MAFECTLGLEELVEKKIEIIVLKSLRFFDLAVFTKGSSYV